MNELPKTNPQSYKYYLVEISGGKISALKEYVDYALLDLPKAAIGTEISFVHGTQGFGAWNQTKVEPYIKDALHISVLGPDPYIVGPISPLPTFFKNNFKIKIKVTPTDMKNIGKQDYLSVYWVSRDDGTWGSNKKYFEIPFTIDGRVQELTYNLKTHYKWKSSGVIETLRIDPGHTVGDIEIESIIFE